MHCTWLTRITVQVHVAFLPQHLKAETKLRGLAVTKAGWVPRSLRKWNDPIRPFWIAKEWQTGKLCWCCNFGYLFPAGCTEKGDGNQNRSWWLHLLSWAQRTWGVIMQSHTYIIEQLCNVSGMVARCVGRRRAVGVFFRVYD